MEKPSQTIRIGELSRLSGKTSRTLHFYEELGLLTPAARTRGGFRLYSQSALMRIEWIGKLQELGFSLQEVSDFLRDLHSYETGPDTMGRLREFYQQKVEDTRAGIERLKTLQEGLLESISFLDDCQSCTSDADTSTCVSCHEAKTRHLPDMVAAIHSTPTSTAR